jgi:hypothetical protein
MNRFKNINSKKTIDAISRLCRLLAHYGNVLNITSHFLDLAEEGSPSALAALFCLNEFSNSTEGIELVIPLDDPCFDSFVQIAEFIAILKIDLEETKRKESVENITMALENVFALVIY